LHEVKRAVLRQCWFHHSRIIPLNTTYVPEPVSGRMAT
jgi:hypothetical protein